jgi:hypothetical protein
MQFGSRHIRGFPSASIVRLKWECDVTGHWNVLFLVFGPLHVTGIVPHLYQKHSEVNYNFLMKAEVLTPHEYFHIPVFACCLLMTYCNPHLTVLLSTVNGYNGEGMFPLSEAEHRHFLKHHVCVCVCVLFLFFSEFSLLPCILHYYAVILHAVVVSYAISIQFPIINKDHLF